jgi:hypothetical protein
MIFPLVEQIIDFIASLRLSAMRDISAEDLPAPKIESILRNVRDGLRTDKAFDPPTLPWPGIKGEARRAAPFLSPGRALLHRLAPNFGGKRGAIKRLHPPLQRPPEEGRRPLLRLG